MKIHETVQLATKTFDELKAFGENDGNSANRQLEIAIEVYLRIRNSPVELQKVIYDLLDDPAKYKIDNDFVHALDFLSQTDETTGHQQIEKAISTYLSIRSLPDKAENEITNLINHHVSRNKDGN